MSPSRISAPRSPPTGADALPRRLLHMDLRKENILVRGGRPVAILDWSNALIGDPALDLARAAEYGSLTPAALDAYGDAGSFTMSSVTPLGPLGPLTPRQAVYRLDTAVMLSHVFLDGAPDQAKARPLHGADEEPVPQAGAAGSATVFFFFFFSPPPPPPPPPQKKKKKKKW